MKNIFWLFLFVLLVGCEEFDEIQIEAVVGEYFHTVPSKDYSHLELRSDFTYHFDQAYSHSCEVWGHHYGSWKLDKNKISLFEGINLDSMMTVKGKFNEKGDTLKIIFEKELLEVFPNLTVRFGFDKVDYKPENNQIIFDKYSFLSRNDFLDAFEKDENGEIIYDYFPLAIHLRSGKFFKEINRFLDYEKLKLELNDFRDDFSNPELLLEYKSKDGILYSEGKDDWIYEHKLIQREETEF